MCKDKYFEYPVNDNSLESVTDCLVTINNRLNVRSDLRSWTTLLQIISQTANSQNVNSQILSASQNFRYFRKLVLLKLTF